jgi:hypothetical protein
MCYCKRLGGLCIYFEGQSPGTGTLPSAPTTEAFGQRMKGLSKFLADEKVVEYEKCSQQYNP